jgi:Uma2 family endonuclease
MATPLHKPATLADLLAIPEEERFHEILDGELVRKAHPTGEHGGAQSSINGALIPAFQRKGGPPDHPGGWWFATEVEIRLEASQIVRPDVIGWRRERSPERPRGTPVDLLPDWVCEILSSHPSRDTVKKLRIYQRARVPHYWIVDPVGKTLTVYRWSDAGYVAVLTATDDERVRAEPFDAIEISVSMLLGDE